MSKTRLYLHLSRFLGFITEAHFKITLKLFLENLEKKGYITINKYSLQVNKKAVIDDLVSNSRKYYYLLDEFEIR